MQTQQHILQPEHWIDRYADDMFAFAMSKTGKETLAEDLVQDTFLSALNALNGFKGDSSEKTWLYAILKNKIKDHFKKASTRYEVPDFSFAQTDPGHFFFNDDEEWQQPAMPHSWEHAGGFSPESKEFQSVLDSCLDKLPDTWHAAIRMKWIEGNESEAICKELEVSSSNFWVIIHRAKLQLRDCLEKNWFD
ncbi:MAG: sigma-70 family RNA polymerase sigma factor [Bacteroidetes bacterium]|nr:sigma-70 family RNA polymerase sigma factor [Bacteroidota bacterium]